MTHGGSNFIGLANAETVLDVKLCDSQGRLLFSDGAFLDGGSCKSSMPRSNPDGINQMTDIFALGSAMYFIITGHSPFPELDSRIDAQEIASWFRSGIPLGLKSTRNIA